MSDVIGSFVVFIALLLLTSLGVMLIWNGTVVELFVIPKVTYGQAVGLTLLCDLLFNKSTTPTKSS